jgi:hypothetical protein
VLSREDSPKNSFSELTDADMSVPQGEFAGQYVDIFGQIIRDPEPDMKAAITSVAKQAEEAMATGKLSPDAETFFNRKTTIFSSNTMGYGPGSSLTHRRPAKQGKVSTAMAKFLTNPGVPPELADIYDHVVGFARVPLGFSEWRDAMRRISETQMPLRRKAAEQFQNSAPTSKNQINDYNRYLAAFNAIDPVDAKQSELARDLSVGVNVFGEKFKDGDENVAAVGIGTLTTAEKKAKNAPDKTKLIELAKQIDNLILPDVKGEDANKIIIDVKILLGKISLFIKEKCNNL